VGRLNFGYVSVRNSFQFELLVPVLLQLPSQSVAPSPQGALGLGATYSAANGGSTNVASAFLNSAFWRFAPGERFTFKAGRFEFLDGLESSAPNETLVFVKRTRIAERLISTNPWTHVGRSFDGVQSGFKLKHYQFTGLAAVPREGMFQANGWVSMETPFVYASVSQSLDGKRVSSDRRTFYAFYDDLRNLTPVDNRPAAVRSGGSTDIRISTFGAHQLLSVTGKRGILDLTLWGAGQLGTWAGLRQRAYAYATEIGWQPNGLKNLRPWLRSGWNQTSGDGNAKDGVHGTFFPFLLGPRPYARLPFFTQMNSTDAFAEMLVRPRKEITIRLDFHRLWLTSAQDLWYQGGAAYQSTSFGFAGRPSSGSRNLGDLYDGSVDFNLSSQALVSFYLGRVSGGAVVNATYPNGGNCRFAYLEMTYRFKRLSSPAK
jgi:hypothetical protein